MSVRVPWPKPQLDPLFARVGRCLSSSIVKVYAMQAIGELAVQ